MSQLPFSFCPIRIGSLDFMESKLPLDTELKAIDVCLSVCGEIYDEAVIKDNTDGPYDTYDASKEEDCSHYNVQFSHDAIHAINVHTRSYAIVDECADCNMELGEQNYTFECPLRAEK